MKKKNSYDRKYSILNLAAWWACVCFRKKFSDSDINFENMGFNFHSIYQQISPDTDKKDLENKCKELGIMLQLVTIESHKAFAYLTNKVKIPDFSTAAIQQFANVPKDQQNEYTKYFIQCISGKKIIKKSFFRQFVEKLME